MDANNKNRGKKMKKVLIAALMGLLVFGFAGLAKAEIFINFDDPSLFLDDGSGNLTYDVSATESIQFYGEITQYFDPSDEVTTPDHTTTHDSFLRGDGYEVDADLDFGIDGFEFWWLAPQDAVMHGWAYGWDEDDNYFDSESDEVLIGTGAWQRIQANGFPGQVYGIYFYNDDETGVAIDDLKLYLPGDQFPEGFGENSVVPEPASMALMGLGLLGLARRLRRKFVG